MARWCVASISHEQTRCVTGLLFDGLARQALVCTRGAFRCVAAQAVVLRGKHILRL